jgi:hypothetical protein
MQCFPRYERPSRNLFENHVATAVLFKFSEYFRDWNSCGSQLSQDFAFSLHADEPIITIPIGIAVPPPLFDYHESSRENREIKRLKNTAFAPLCKRFEDMIIQPDRSARFPPNQLPFPEQILEPRRYGTSRCAPIPMRLGS